MDDPRLDYFDGTVLIAPLPDAFNDWTPANCLMCGRAMGDDEWGKTQICPNCLTH